MAPRSHNPKAASKGDSAPPPPAKRKRGATPDGGAAKAATSAASESENDSESDVGGRGASSSTHVKRGRPARCSCCLCGKSPEERCVPNAILVGLVWLFSGRRQWSRSSFGRLSLVFRVWRFGHPSRSSHGKQRRRRALQGKRAAPEIRFKLPAERTDRQRPLGCDVRCGQYLGLHSRWLVLSDWSGMPKLTTDSQFRAFRLASARLTGVVCPHLAADVPNQVGFVT